MRNGLVKTRWKGFEKQKIVFNTDFDSYNIREKWEVIDNLMLNIHKSYMINEDKK